MDPYYWLKEFGVIFGADLLAGLLLFICVEYTRDIKSKRERRTRILRRINQDLFKIANEAEKWFDHALQDKSPLSPFNKPQGIPDFHSIAKALISVPENWEFEEYEDIQHNLIRIISGTEECMKATSREPFNKAVKELNIFGQSMKEILSSDSYKKNVLKYPFP